MKALSLSQELFPNQIPVLPGKYLGEGADGDVYLVSDDINKVIKFAVIYEGLEDVDKIYNTRISVLTLLQHNNYPIIAKIFSYGYIGSSYRNQIRYDSLDNEYIYNQKFILYYYIMERLYKISEDEKKIFYSTISHKDMGNLSKIYHIKEIEKMINEMSNYLDFNKNKILEFCRGINKIPFHHNDIHERNIMKDKYGNFKLVDFDRASLILV